MIYILISLKFHIRNIASCNPSLTKHQLWKPSKTTNIIQHPHCHLFVPKLSRVGEKKITSTILLFCKILYWVGQQIEAS